MIRHAVTDKPQGLLNPQAGQKHFHLSRYPPAADLCFFVERYWVVEWDLRGQAPYVSENLPFPCVNLVIEPGKSGVFGVVTGKFAYQLQGKGRVFGIKFRPGAFFPFVKTPVSRFTDRTVPLSDLFGEAGSALEAAILAVDEPPQRIERAEAFLRERLPEHDDTVEVINQIIDGIMADRAITRVDDVAARCHLSQRTLQRLFSHYVGVSPKWVIKRYRLHEAAEQLAAGGSVDWPKMALELGYFDQAHFIKDFKTIVGTTPAQYVRQIGTET